MNAHTDFKALAAGSDKMWEPHEHPFHEEIVSAIEAGKGEDVRQKAWTMRSDADDQWIGAIVAKGDVDAALKIRGECERIYQIVAPKQKWGMDYQHDRHGRSNRYHWNGTPYHGI